MTAPVWPWHPLRHEHEHALLLPDADALERLLARALQLPRLPAATRAAGHHERILALAQRTASWCNAQPWQLAITRGAGTERFRQAMFAHAREPAAPDFPWPREYQGAYLQRRRECGFALYESVGVARGDREGSARQTLENFRFFGAPHVAVVSTAEALGIYGAIDCGAYVANFMLAARSLGVACDRAGGAGLAFRADPRALRAGR